MITFEEAKTRLVNVDPALTEAVIVYTTWTDRECKSKIARAKADAWEEGWRVGADDQKRWNGAWPDYEGPTPNPYHTEGTTAE